MRKCRTNAVRGVWATIAAALTSFASAQEATATRPDSRPVSTESRPVEVDPTVLFRAKALARRDGFAPWSWPTADAFAVLVDRETLRPRPIWTARADVEGTEALRPNGYDVAIANGVDETGRPLSRIVAAAASDGLGADLSGSIRDAVGQALDATANAPDRHSLRFPRWNPTNVVRCTRLVAQGRTGPSTAHATLHGYVAALLEDSPGDPELPEGQCSMDELPALAAEEFAREAAQQGALGRFLRLRLTILGERFVRVAYSGYGDAALGVKVEGLSDAPVDLPAFLAGLVLQFDGGPMRPIEIGTERLGRAIASSSEADRLTRWLIATAQDESVDAHNRLRAAQTLFSVYAHETGREPLNRFSARTRSPEFVLAKMRGLRLSRPAEIWLGRPD